MTDNYVSTRKKLLAILNKINKNPVRGPRGGVLSGGVLSGGVLSGGKKRGRPRKKRAGMHAGMSAAGMRAAAMPMSLQMAPTGPMPRPMVMQRPMPTMATQMTQPTTMFPYMNLHPSTSVAAGHYEGDHHEGMGRKRRRRRGGEVPANEPSTVAAAGRKRRRRKGGATAAMNPWIQHVRQVAAERSLPYKEALKIASQTYRK